MLIKVDPRGREVNDPLGKAVCAAGSRETQPTSLVELLRRSTLFVLQHPGDGMSNADVALGRVSLGVQQMGGRSYVAVFSSTSALESSAPEGASFAGLPGAALLEMWSSDDWLILNPGARCQLLVSPTEVAAIARDGETGRLRIEVDP